MILTPAMQGVILAIAKATQVFDKEGPEAGLIKVVYSKWLHVHIPFKLLNFLKEFF